MKHNFHVLITYILITAGSCRAMEITTITKPSSIAFPENNTVVVGGKGGCGIFNSESQDLIHQLTTDDITHLVTGNHIIAFREENILTFYDKKTGKRSWTASFMRQINPLTLKNNTVFIYDCSSLKSFNHTQEAVSIVHTDCQIKTSEEYKNALISCHPQTNTILYCSNDKTLSIAQPDSDPVVKINLNTNLTLCRGGEYSANGTTIVFGDNDNKYFIYDLLDKNKFAYELTADNKKYVAAAFHPFMHFLALLSHDNVIQYWDYLSRKVVATTRALAENILININKYKRPTKRLAFSPDGSQLALALKNKWSVIDVPNNNNNLLMIYYLLHTNQIPNEVIN